MKKPSKATPRKPSKSARKPVRKPAKKAAKTAARKPAKAAKPAPAKKKAPAKKTTGPRKAAAKPVLLSGGNPQVAKGYGDAPVQAYIKAMPGWKSKMGRRLDALITAAIPDVRKAVKWNSPLYGVEGKGWFLGVHVFERYVKVAFFRGASLRPMPSGESRQEHVRYLDIHEDDVFDEAQFTDWVKQASRLPGEKM